MNSRERVIKAIEFEKPDRIPNGCYNLALPPGSRREALKKLFEKYPQDFANVPGAARTLEWGIQWSKGTFTDDWGITWKNLQDGVIGQPMTHPLDDWKKLDQYQMPDPLKNIEELRKSFNHADHSKYVLADGGSIWQIIHYLRGFKETLLDVLAGRKELFLLIDRLVNFNLERLKLILEMNVDGVMFGDDWGTQQRLMLKPEQWRRIFMPYYKKMFDTVRKKGKDIFFHSDGYVIDILPDLIDIGLNVANIQVSLLGIKTISERFGGKLCIAADVDRQHILPFGTPRHVRKLVKDIVLAFKGLDGGLILYGEIGPDVPIKNAESMLKSLWDYGKLG
ncbi:MAG: uroporphyrinogen decarboxylase family protein [Candidatus Bathyarchaeia archaeon]